MTDVKTIMTADETGMEMVEFARQTAIRLKKDNLGRTQIRNIFTEVRQIEAMWEINKPDALRRLNMLRPKMAYQTDRNKEVKFLEEVLGEAIVLVDQSARRSEKEQDKAFKRFVELFESILAYHHSIGGRK